MSESLDDGWWSELVEHSGRIASGLVAAKPGQKGGESGGRSIADSDILSLVLLVLLQAARSAEEDLKAILDHVRAINGQKQRHRDLLAKLRASELDALVDDLKQELDSLSELGEQDSLRLQLAMDRQAKLESAIANIMKKTSETAASIVSNLK